MSFQSKQEIKKNEIQGVTYVLSVLHVTRPDISSQSINGNIKIEYC